MSTVVIETPASASTPAGVPALGNSAAIAAKLAGSPTRYTYPNCWDYPAPCGHAENYHVPAKPDLDVALRFYGMTRRRDGSAHLSSPPRPRPGSMIPARTRQNIAACAAVGLSYWSEAPVPNGLWAVDNARQAHLVKVDRRAQTAAVDCHPGHGLRDARHDCTRVRQREPYVVPASSEATAPLLDVVDDGGQA